MTDRSFIGRAGLAGLSVVALMLALWASGGPAAGQREARDATRFDDLQALADLGLCLAEEDGALPDILRRDPACAPDPRRADPFTGAEYVYERLSATGFRLCATFERPDALTVWDGSIRRFDPDSGCLIIHREPG